MTTSRTIQAALFVLIGGVVAAQQQQPSSVISTGRVGNLEVGAPAEDVYRIFGRDSVKLVDLNYEGYFTLAMEVRIPASAKQPSLVIRLREFPCYFTSVQMISVHDSRYRTERGLGVGSTLSEVQRAYRVKQATGEGRVSAWLEEQSIGFGLDRMDYSPSSRVTSVGVGLDPDVIRQRRCPK